MLSSWTDKEKFQLLRSLKKHGSSNVQIIGKEIPTKSLQEIEYAITYCSKAAKKSLKANNKSRHRQAPIDKWIQFTKRHTADLRRARDFATVFKVFAFNEQLSAKQSDEINFEDLYLFLADLSLGNAPRQLDCKTHKFLMKSISETARKCKHGTLDKELQLIADLNKKNISKAATVKEDDDLENSNILQLIQNNAALNPLKIEWSFLRNEGNQGQKKSGLSKLRNLSTAMKNRLMYSD